MPYLATRNLACQMEFFKYPQGMFCTCSSGREPRGGIWRGRGRAFGIKKIGTEYVLQTFCLSHWNGPIRALPNWRALKYPPSVFKGEAQGCRPATNWTQKPGTPRLRRSSYYVLIAGLVIIPDPCSLCMEVSFRGILNTNVPLTILLGCVKQPPPQSPPSKKHITTVSDLVSLHMKECLWRVAD